VVSSYSMRLKQRILVGSCIFVVGAFPYLYAIFRYKQHNWTALTYPVVLKPGIIESPYFRTDLNGTYVISLIFDNMRDQKRENCLQGIDLPKGSCKGIPRTLDFSWAVRRREAGFIASGMYPGVWSMGADDFGRFESVTGAQERVLLNVFQDAEDLNSAHPWLRVEAHWSYWEKWIILWQFGFLLLIGVCLPALIWTVWPLIFHRRKPA
jgi:hypothetical protein